ncbi:FecR family protein [Rufibacter immobilis]|uniref:FecR family protein n=1 Tax=Rufibacter immobilis TaxID=1348778 RepID=UPI0035ED3EF4
MDYSTFSPKDFVKDRYFQQWVICPDPSTEAFWQAWLAQHPFKQEDVAEAREIIHAMEFGLDYEANLAFVEVWEKLAAQQASSAPQPAASPAWYLHYQKVAAVFLGLLVMGTVLYFLSKPQQPQLLSFSTQYGEVKTLLLPDSSQVTLNGNSTLSYAQHWDKKSDREVHLQGEAFFAVRKKKQALNAKFKVHTTGLTVEVLGTKFNVNHRRNSTKVVLNSGKVRLQIEDPVQPQSIDMVPGELVHYSNQTKVAQKRAVNPELFASWRNNQLIFNKTSLAEIALLLEDTYGLQMVWQDPALAQKHFTGSVPANDIALLLQTLSKLFDLEITHKGNQLLVQPLPR